MPNKSFYKTLPCFLYGIFTLTACSHYAPGYSGWTTEQVEKIKGYAKARYYNIPKSDAVLFGVNYVDFDKKNYTTYDKTKIASVKCEGDIYKNIRLIDGVSLSTSVCLNSSKKVNRIIFYFKGPDNIATSKVFKMADNQLKENYGRFVFPDLENRFMTKDKYKSIYFKDSPSEGDLMAYDRILVSDYITSIDVTSSNKASRADGYDRMIFDIKLRDYESVQTQSDRKHGEKLKSQLNSAE